MSANVVRGVPASQSATKHRGEFEAAHVHLRLLRAKVRVLRVLRYRTRMPARRDIGVSELDGKRLGDELRSVPVLRWGRDVDLMLHAALLSGNSTHCRPSRIGSSVFTPRASTYCFRKNGTSAAMHWSRSERTQSSDIA